MARESNGGSRIGNLLVFASGIVVGLLVATKPGRDLRAQIGELFQQGRERSERLLRRGKEQVEDAKERMSGEGGKEPFYETGKYS
ncbi:MAG: YtxH domain-containing protein [Elusimicrobia bacterium]|nr:YtxH domain-containing protein [Elusimicrobiota bacterium]